MKAYDAFMSGQYEIALEWLSKIKEQHGGSSALVNDIGVVLHKLGKTEEALSAFREAQGLDDAGDKLLVDNLIGIVEEKLKEERTLKEQLQLAQASSERGKTPVTLSEEALGLLLKGSFAEARSLFCEAARAQKEAMEGVSNSFQQALSFLETAQGKFEKVAQRPKYEGDYIHFPEVSLRCCVGEDLHRVQSTDKCFVLGKTPSMLEALLARLNFHPRNIIELGVWKGGSLVLFNEMFAPKKLAVLDFMAKVVEPLERYVAHHSENVSLHLATNQADREKLQSIYAEVFRGESVDFILDDASHFYEESKVSFETLFPYVTEGGIYVLEDWGWAHWPGDHWQKNEGGDYFRHRRPMSNLAIELSLLAASRPSLISEVVVTSGSVYVRRGPEKCSSPISINDLVLNRGRPVPLLQ